MRECEHFFRFHTAGIEPRCVVCEMPMREYVARLESDLSRLRQERSVADTQPLPLVGGGRAVEEWIEAACGCVLFVPCLMLGWAGRKFLRWFPVAVRAARRARKRASHGKD